MTDKLQLAMKILPIVMAIVHIFIRQETYGQSCVAAGFSSCCTSGCSTGGCYCDRECYNVGDCCADIHQICSDLYYSTTLTGTTETTTEILQELYPTTTPATETGPGATTASSLTITTITDYQDCSKTVQTREAVAWALLFLVVLLFTGLLFINVIIVFLVYKHRQRRDNTAEALAYEMADNPCYESSKISNTLETNIYEQIEPERVHM